MKRGNFIRRLYILNAAVICVLILLGGTTFYMYALDTLEKSTRTNLNELASRTYKSLERNIIEMDRMALYLSANKTIKDSFLKLSQADDPLMRQEIYRQVESAMITLIIPNSAQDLRICVYGVKGDYISIGNRLSDLPGNTRLLGKAYSDWYDSLPIIRRGMTLLSPHKDVLTADSEIYYSVIREIIDIETYKTYGLVEIQCPYNDLSDTLAFSSDSMISAFLYDAYGDRIFPISQEEDSLYTNEITSTATSPLIGWQLVLMQSKGQVYSLMLPTVLVLSSVCVLIAVFSLGLMHLLLNRITKPLSQLNEAMREVNINNLHIELDYSDTNDEILYLHQTFDTMLGNLRQSMEDAVNLRAQGFRAHMIALQAQMDPHFLFNTIGVINSYARESGASKIMDMCGSLANMLRYISAYSEELSPLKDELNHTRTYLQLMKYRYEDQFDFSFDLPPDETLENITVPKLCIQPLSENCFHHGFKRVAPPWRVHISVECGNDTWRVSICDNGGGFDPDAVNQAMLRADEFAKNPEQIISTFKIGGMGLANILSRLKLQYGDRMFFDVKSSDNSVLVTIGGPV